MNLENPLHLLCITMPFDLPTMNIGYRQIVDRVKDSLHFLDLRFFIS